MGFMESLFGKKTEVGDITTPQARAAQQFLQQLYSSGSAGGINLGQAYSGSLGNYNLTGGEQDAYSQLAGLFNGQDITKARETYTNLADTKFDPSDPSSGYAAYSRALAKEQGEANDVINREGAITGTRFGSRILNTKQDMAENFQNQRAMKLAELFQNSRASQLAGAQGLQGLVGTQANLANQQASMAGLERELMNQEAQAKYSEFQRQRGETLSRIDLAGTEASRNPLLGITQYGESSPWSGLINSALGAAGTAIGGPVGGIIGSSLGSLFSSSGSNSTQSQLLGFNTANYR